MALCGVSAAVWWLCFGPNICSKSPPGLSGLRLIFSKVRFWLSLGFFLGLWLAVAFCGTFPGGFAVKGVTLYPRKPASSLRCSPVVSRWSVSCSGFPNTSTGLRLHPLPAPALAVCICPAARYAPTSAHIAILGGFCFRGCFSVSVSKLSALASAVVPSCC